VLVLPSSKHELRGHHKSAKVVIFLPDGTLVSAGADNAIRVWTIDKNSASSKELLGHKDAIEELAYNPQNPSQVASTGPDKAIRVWDTKYVTCFLEFYFLCVHAHAAITVYSLHARAQDRKMHALHRHQGQQHQPALVSRRQLHMLGQQG
jgi:WD40 repeat protein